MKNFLGLPKGLGVPETPPSNKDTKSDEEMHVNTALWTFYYKVGPAPMYGTVEARDEGLALKVAARWCQKNGHRPPASVKPLILATEAILKEPEPGVPEPLAGAVEATTGVRNG